MSTIIPSNATVARLIAGKILTGKDWQRPDLQKRYAGYFSAYLARKIILLDDSR